MYIHPIFPIGVYKHNLINVLYAVIFTVNLTLLNWLTRTVREREYAFKNIIRHATFLLAQLQHPRNFIDPHF